MYYRSTVRRTRATSNKSQTPDKTQNSHLVRTDPLGPGTLRSIGLRAAYRQYSRLRLSDKLPQLL
jgi:hypothetical protein